MTEENQRNESTAPESALPVKRGRGRPRKDDYVYHGEKSSDLPGSDGAKKTRCQNIDSTADEDSAFVGQIVSGVLDGSFDAGYLLTVKVCKTDTVLRGVVFDPRLSAPISAENDVAPHVKMFRRSKIPLPIAAKPLNQVPPVMPQKEVKNDQPANPLQCNVAILQSEGSVRGPLDETNDILPQAAPQGSSQPKATLPKGWPDGVDRAVLVAPQVHTSQIEKGKSANILPKGEIILLPDNRVVAQASQSELKNQATVEMLAPLSEPKTENWSTASQENQTSIQMQALSNGAAAAPTDTKVEAKTKQAIQIGRVNEMGKEMPNAIKQVPEAATHACSELKPAISVGASKGEAYLSDGLPVLALQDLNSPVTKF
ncbi:uncharacterized protein LOC131221317 [Magnolia sinica]|uniref:uncharacterized protein LOC131221317 n=1 Tax=Magnolia sinica TaxID=86752 RepID=UPI00265A46D0|nr:uncharacterized protein LOC131221317 [Magnolia sinica]XP_058072514.1 uncharacterized protein LOC131221317 [Magnolia sinica]XP_058072516.1 uncharacterized protein LOC131221317 [Magnolia sinica]XP_058072517.1 uncharacterized protein LOC131221317 [Magnolia sinica]